MLRGLCLGAALTVLGLPLSAAALAQTYTGKVLPFEIIVAVRNYNLNRNGMLPAQVSISVQGGTQADWLATAAYVAEKAIVNDVTFSEVTVFVPSPWGDRAPQARKRLAQAYYSGPDPSLSPWPDKPWLVMAQGHAASLPDVEYGELADKLLGEEPPSDDDSASNAADAKAIRLLVRKYHLPKRWKPDEQLDAMDPKAVQVEDRRQIVVSDSDDAEASIEELRACLSSDEGIGFRGCRDTSVEYQFTP